MCGEHLVRPCVRPICRGSSPHVRGTLLRARVPDRGRGIIPACAGNTMRRNPRRRVSWDHPRMCGEHFTAASTLAAVSGSSPHVRGTRKAESNVTRVLGIIPACAGNTLTESRLHDLKRDHPRMCGEHRFKDKKTQKEWGSSPHVRGTLRVGVLGGEHRGIIPACAGNT